MKTDHELTSTNQLIKIIRGEASAFPVEMMHKEKSTITLPGEQAMKLKAYYRAIFLLLVCMIIFTFISVPYLSVRINDLARARDTVVVRQEELNSLIKSVYMWEHDIEKADMINSLYTYLTTPRPYISNTIKEISHLMPQNCYVTDLNISFSSGQSLQQIGNISMKATLVDDPSFAQPGAPLSQICYIIENSDLFSEVRIRDQASSSLFNYNAVDFQMEFSEP